jgi:hypothetical protein
MAVPLWRDASLVAFLSLLWLSEAIYSLLLLVPAVPHVVVGVVFGPPCLRLLHAPHVVALHACGRLGLLASVLEIGLFLGACVVSAVCCPRR